MELTCKYIERTKDWNIMDGNFVVAFHLSKLNAQYLVKCCNEYDGLKAKADLCDELRVTCLREVVATFFPETEGSIGGQCIKNIQQALPKAESGVE